MCCIYIYSTSCEINKKANNNKTSFFIWTSLTCKPRPSSLSPLGFHTRARSYAHRDWLRRATKTRPPGDVTAAVPVALGSATSEPHWRAWSGARRRSHRGPPSLTAMGVKRSLTPDSLNAVRPETRTIKGCSWELTSSAVSPPIELREEEEEEKDHLEMRSGSPEGNLVKDVRSNRVCVFWAGTMSAVCVRAVVSPSQLPQPRSLCLLYSKDPSSRFFI